MQLTMFSIGTFSPMGGTAGQLGRNWDCPAEIGTADMSGKPLINTKYNMKSINSMSDWYQWWYLSWGYATGYARA